MKKKQLKKIVSIVLTSAMLMTSIPGGVISAEEIQAGSAVELAAQPSKPEKEEIPVQVVEPNEIEEPETSHSVESAPAETPDSGKARASTTTESTKTEKTDSEKTDSGKTDSGKTDSGKTDSVPAESKPAESEAPESKPTESEAPESKPTESETPESKPTESEPAESKPTESEPSESKPSESEPSDPDPSDPMKKKVKVHWKTSWNFKKSDNEPYWTGEEIPLPEAYATYKGFPVMLDVTVPDEPVKEIGKYTVTASLSGFSEAFFELTDSEYTFEVLPQPLKVTWNKLTQTYLGQELKPEISVERLDGKKVDFELQFASEEVALSVGEYPVSVALTGVDEEDAANYSLPENMSETFVISPLAFEAKLKEGTVLNKQYFMDDPSFKDSHELSILSEDVPMEMHSTLLEEVSSWIVSGFDNTIFQREASEEVGGQSAIGLVEGLNQPEQNYAFSYLGSDYFEIKPLEVKVSVSPDAVLSKYFGQKEPEDIPYQIDTFTGDMPAELGTYNDEELKSKVRQELEALAGKSTIFEREPGEGVGTYPIKLNDALTGLQNYNVTYEGADSFEIKAIEVTVGAIDSRSNTLTVTTSAAGADLSANRDSSIGMYCTLGVALSSNLTAVSYDSGSVVSQIGGQKYEISGTSVDIPLPTVTYSAAGKTWEGYLPAGASVSATVYCSGLDGSEQQVAVSQATTVGKKTITLQASFDQKRTDAKGVDYVIKGDKWNVTSPDGQNELVYISGAQFTGEAYQTLAASVEPVESDGLNAHNMQTLNAEVLDTLNLEAEKVTQTFYFDGKAFAPYNVRFENRGDKLTVTIPDSVKDTATVNISGTSFTMTAEADGTYSADISKLTRGNGSNLLHSGTTAVINYTDEAGNASPVASASATKSAVNTPISFTIRPSLNVSGYINGKSGSLLITGSACACEKINITVAGEQKSTYATRNAVWADVAGSWELTVDMASLPEGKTFMISAEYDDVIGQGYSMTARYDAFVAQPTVTSPIFEGMSYIGGFVEKGTSVGLVINGNTSRLYEIEVDRFGHFSTEDFPTLFAGDDSFDLYVTDIAGNTNVIHYDIPQPNDLHEVTAKVNALGTYFYEAQQKNNRVCVAAPIAMTDFAEGEDTIEIPLLLGTAYVVGTMTLKKTDDGIMVTTEIKLDKDIDTEDYTVENEKLCVYRERPMIDQIDKKTGTEFKNGDVLKFEGRTYLWLTYESDMTMLAEDIETLPVFEYKKSTQYEKFQGR